VAGGSEHSFVEVVDDGWQRRPYLLQIHNAGIESVGLWGSAAAGQEQQKQQQQQQQQYSLEGVGTAKPQDGSNYAKHSQYMQQHARHAQRMQASPKRGGGASGGRGWDGGSDTFQVTDQQCRREDYKGLLQQDDCGDSGGGMLGSVCGGGVLGSACVGEAGGVNGAGGVKGVVLSGEAGGSMLNGESVRSPHSQRGVLVSGAGDLRDHPGPSLAGHSGGVTLQGVCVGAGTDRQSDVGVFVAENVCAPAELLQQQQQQQQRLHASSSTKQQRQHQQHKQQQQQQTWFVDCTPSTATTVTAAAYLTDLLGISCGLA
jgi:hypothetical protein